MKFAAFEGEVRAAKKRNRLIKCDKPQFTLCFWCDESIIFFVESNFSQNSISRRNERMAKRK